MKDKNSGKTKMMKNVVKSLVPYNDNSYTNTTRLNLSKINDNYTNNNIRVHARNILLSKSIIPNLLTMIINSRIGLSILYIEDKWKEDDKYTYTINELLAWSNNAGVLSVEKMEDQGYYQYNNTLGKIMAKAKHCSIENINEKYVYVREIEFVIQDKSVQSIYNRGSFAKGGRLYGPVWNEIPKELRQYIFIDSKPTVSVDFKAHHIRLSYHVDNLECPYEDPYAIEGYDRDQVKKASLVSINAADMDGAVFATIKKVKKDLYQNITEQDAECLILKFVEKHPKILGKIATDTGVALQFVDSEILKTAILAMAELGICALGVHDEVIVQEEHLSTALKILEEAYQANIMTNGFKPVLEIGEKPLDEEALKEKIHLPRISSADDYSKKAA